MATLLARRLARSPPLGSRLAARAMSGKVLTCATEADYDAAVKASEGSLTTVYWTASWCGPCQMIAPIFSELASELPDATFLKVDVDEQAGLAQDHGISAMPTFHFHKDGQKIDEIVGADIEKLSRYVRAHGGA